MLPEKYITRLKYHNRYLKQWIMEGNEKPHSVKGNK